MAIDISVDQFEAEVLDKSGEERVVVDFWAPWCNPCKMLGPTLEEVCEEEGLKLVKINVDENSDLARQFGIRGIPAVKFFKDGEVVDEFTGVQPEEQIRSVVT